MDSHRITEAISKALWLITASLFFIALLALIIISLEQIYAGVVKPLLAPNNLPKIFWVGALISAAIPFGFLTVYSCIAFVTCSKGLWKLISHRKSVVTNKLFEFF
jgi:hypothetical protein